MIYLYLSEDRIQENMVELNWENEGIRIRWKCGRPNGVRGRAEHADLPSKCAESSIHNHIMQKKDLKGSNDETL